MRAADGWFALSLNRPDDWALLPAWLGLPAVDDPGRWPAVHDRCADRPRDELVLRGAQLGLPIGALPHADRRDVPGRFGVIEHAVGTGAVGPSRPRPGRPLRVADLSSMWAGPLCGSVLAAAGAHVLKVESTTRPDGTRTGSPEFYELLNGAKEEVLLDLGTAEGVRRLETLLRSVDVVIESSRPRALRQLGLSAEDLLADAGGPSVWVSITGHGRDGTAGERVGFGDDAAVAGGLVQLWDGAPTFCGDAIADPLTGLTAAAATLDALARGQKVLLDVALSRVAAHFAGRGALG